MASSDTTISYVLEQIRQAGDVSSRKMFGEVGIYCDGKFVAMICDDQFYIKVTAEGLAFGEGLEEASPYPGAKPALLLSGDRLEDSDWVSELLRITTAALPFPKPKAKTKKAK